MDDPVSDPEAFDDDEIEGSDEHEELTDDDQDVQDDGNDADEEDAEDGDAATGTEKKKRKPKEVKPLFGVHASAAKEGTANPERNKANRAQGYAKRFLKALRLRQDIAMDILNRVILDLTKEERMELRMLGSMLHDNSSFPVSMGSLTQ
jgi:hypothetical protein